ncbi:MAG: ORF6N domain-containing protein [Thermoleophilia bacterium]|nr:ORF6N domain-containing protein [Thermoleophilia bacterium]
MSQDGKGKNPRLLNPVDLPVELIQQRILVIRGHNVMIDVDLAAMYGVETRALVQAVKRNVARFPSDFMFQIDGDEYAILRSQSVISSTWGGRRTPPYAFTEQGVAMLSSVLRSHRAVAVNIAIMRAFVELRQIFASHVDLVRKVENLELLMAKTDESRNLEIAQIIEVIKQLMGPPLPTRRRPVGFIAPDDTQSRPSQQDMDVRIPESLTRCTLVVTVPEPMMKYGTGAIGVCAIFWCDTRTGCSAALRCVAGARRRARHATQR